MNIKNAKILKHLETHPKSAKSISWYFADLWNVVKDYDYKLIGKPYGCTPMLEAWLNDPNLKEYHDLILNYDKAGIEHESLPFIDYADFTLGNALGIAQGISIANPSKKIFVFISDAQMNMGVVQEAISSIASMHLNNILLAIDYNFKGSRGELLNLPRIDLDGWNCSQIRYPSKTGMICKYTPNAWFYINEQQISN